MKTLKSFIVSDPDDRRCWRPDQKATVPSIDQVERMLDSKQARVAPLAVPARNRMKGNINRDVDAEIIRSGRAAYTALATP